MAKSRWLNIFPGATRNRADYLIEGRQAFEAIARAIRSARREGHYVYILGWMLDIDFPLLQGYKTSTLFELLKRASESGVEVRILVWDNLIPGYAKLNRKNIPRLNRYRNIVAHIDESTYFPQKSKQFIAQINPYIQQLVSKYGSLFFRARAYLKSRNITPGYIRFRLMTLMATRSIGSHHEKVVIVKGSEGLVAFCGGIDFNRNRILSANVGSFGYYHDTACRVVGPAAYQILERFRKRWANHPRASTVSLLGSKEKKPGEAGHGNPYALAVGTYNDSSGVDKDRSLRDAYFKVIDNAKRHIYIEDQYLVNLDVARRLNRKVRQSGFKNLTMVIQDAAETSDILIPTKKRSEFMTAVLKGASKAERQKVLLAVPDKQHWKKERYHPGIHAKTLLADDEIAIIGSANVNQRSFTVDSETSVVVFDDLPAGSKQGFAFRFRSALWKHYSRRFLQPKPRIYQDTALIPDMIRRLTLHGFTLRNYVKRHYIDENKLDLDEAIIREIKSWGAAGASIVLHATGNNLQATTAILSPVTIRGIFKNVWEFLVDPKAD